MIREVKEFQSSRTYSVSPLSSPMSADISEVFPKRKRQGHQTFENSKRADSYRQIIHILPLPRQSQLYIRAIACRLLVPPLICQIQIRTQSIVIFATNFVNANSILLFPTVRRLHLLCTFLPPID
jgi:hypothetical protein